MKEKYPQLFSFLAKPKCSIQFFLEQEPDRVFMLPHSQQAAAQLQEVQNFLLERIGDENLNDKWTYSWGNSRFRSSKAYTKLIGHSEASPLFKQLCASSNLGKHKFFFWLLIRDRLNTRNLLKRKNMELDDYTCVLYNIGCEETNFHLFFECTFIQTSWNTIPISWDFNLPPLDMVIVARSNFGSPIFREIFITACWTIWRARNAIFFIMIRLISVNGRDCSSRSLV